MKLFILGSNIEESRNLRSFLSQHLFYVGGNIFASLDNATDEIEAVIAEEFSIPVSVVTINSRQRVPSFVVYNGGGCSQYFGFRKWK